MPAGVVDRAGIADRYARHRAIAGFSQDALRSSRFAVVGAGAIGNEVVKNLCLLGVGGIDVYDLDTVELHNLTRSVLLREADLGAQKADCVARRAREIDPSVDVVPVTGDIHDTLGVATVRGYRAVVGALDNFEARLRLNQVCWLAGTDWVNAAIDSRHATVETFPFGRVTPGDEPPACYECGLPVSVHQRIAARHSCGGLQRAAARQRTVPTTAITASIAGAFAVGRALAPGTGAERWLLDTVSGRASVARLPSVPKCPACADLPHAPPIVRLPDRGAGTLAAAARRAGADPIRLSDPLVWRCACAACGPSDRTRGVELRPARTVSDAIMRCPDCNAESVRVEIRDFVEPDELRARFVEQDLACGGPGTPVLARFALAAGLCFDLPASGAVPSIDRPGDPE